MKLFYLRKKCKGKIIKACKHMFRDFIIHVFCFFLSLIKFQIFYNLKYFYWIKNNSIYKVLQLVFIFFMLYVIIIILSYYFAYLLYIIRLCTNEWYISLNLQVVEIILNQKSLKKCVYKLLSFSFVQLSHIINIEPR